MTVEMAIVFPLVVFVICSIIYAGLYMHDKLAIRSIVDEQMYDIDIIARHPVDIHGHVLYEHINDRGIFFRLCEDYSKENKMEHDQILSKLKKSLYITKVETVKINMTHSCVDAKVLCGVVIPFHIVKTLLGKEKMRYEITISKPIFYPTEFTRIFTVFSEVAENTEIGDKVLSKLHEILEGGS